MIVLRKYDNDDDSDGNDDDDDNNLLNISICVFTSKLFSFLPWPGQCYYHSPRRLSTYLKISISLFFIHLPFCNWLLRMDKPSLIISIYLFHCSKLCLYLLYWIYITMSQLDSSIFCLALFLFPHYATTRGIFLEDTDYVSLQLKTLLCEEQLG